MVMMIENGNVCRRARLRNDEKTGGSDGFFSWDGGKSSGSLWVGAGVYDVVWSAFDISQMKAGWTEMGMTIRRTGLVI